MTNSFIQHPFRLFLRHGEGFRQALKGNLEDKERAGGRHLVQEPWPCCLRQPTSCGETTPASQMHGTTSKGTIGTNGTFVVWKSNSLPDVEAQKVLEEPLRTGHLFRRPHGLWSFSRNTQLVGPVGLLGLWTVKLRGLHTTSDGGTGPLPPLTGCWCQAPREAPKGPRCPPPPPAAMPRPAENWAQLLPGHCAVLLVVPTQPSGPPGPAGLLCALVMSQSQQRGIYQGGRGLIAKGQVSLRDVL